MAEVTKMASAGKPVVADISQINNPAPAPEAAPAAQAAAATEGTPAAATPTAEKKEGEGQPPAAAAPEGQQPPAQTEGQPPANTEVVKPIAELSDEELKAIYEKRFPTQVEETPEMKLEKERARDKKMLDLYVANKGDIDTFQKLKEIAKADPVDLGTTLLTHEMKGKGFSEEEVAEALATKYHQVDLEKLERDEDETESEFAERKEKLGRLKEIGSQTLAALSMQGKKEAESILNTLQKQIDDSDLHGKEESEFIAKVDEHSKTLPRKMTLELGMLDNEPLGEPIQVDVSEEDIAAVADILKDPAKREKILFTDNGDINIESLSQILLENRVLKSAPREVFLAGRTDQVNIFRKIYPERTPYGLGVGGNTASSNKNGKAGKLVSAGKPQVVNPVPR